MCTRLLLGSLHASALGGGHKIHKQSQRPVRVLLIPGHAGVGAQELPGTRLEDRRSWSGVSEAPPVLGAQAAAGSAWFRASEYVPGTALSLGHAGS
ncbi:hypothetical protein NDU88_001804 [Pleurodeles waltl]|uniref:Secreted protein n=1 Tax=Pleurodeles waltl TaxID=8319 RepID=A0AAV7U883_PLEWA|nr:hypothetical protein NDU88_001804 [Pleurodeles waltl]